MTKCTSCNDGFKWDDNVVIVNDEAYHDECLKLYPSGYVAFLNGEFIGETENEDGQMAYELFDGLLDEE